MTIALVNIVLAGILTGLALYFFSEGDIWWGCADAGLAVANFGWGIILGIRNTRN